MPLKTSSPPSGKKPVAVPRSAVSSRKRPSMKPSRLRKKNASPSPSKSALKKARHHGGAFATLKTRQQAVERAKLQIWRHLPDINAAIIRLAESGSYLAARALFDFAGIYAVPALEENAPALSLPPAAPLLDGAATAESPEKPATPVNRIEAFLQTLGLDPLSDEEPEPDVAA
ncbi:MAG: hypothetical protein WBM04_08825 [Candidatus Korobacteraceae bacterium]